MLTQNELKAILHYCPNTGIFTRCVTRGNRALAGKIAGNIDRSTGYVQVEINNKRYLCHRLAFLYMMGAWPDSQIDHINMIRNDNRWANLREANNSENNINRGIQKNNTSGFRGVKWSRQRNKWQSYIIKDGKDIYLGSYINAQDAANAYLTAAKQIHGQFHRPSMA